MNYIEKYLELVPNATSFEKEVMQKMADHIEQEVKSKVIPIESLPRGEYQAGYNACRQLVIDNFTRNNI